MVDVFVPPDLLNATHNDANTALFLTDVNIKFIVSNVVKLRHEYSVDKKMPMRTLANHLKSQMRDWTRKRQLNDAAASDNPIETLDYYNKQFIRDMHPLYKHDPFNTHEPDVNVIRDPIYGKKHDQLYTEDIRNLDVWDNNDIYVDDRSTRRTWGNKGLNNPHIIGAHRRHYERDIDEGLQAHEKGPTRTRGYTHTRLLKALEKQRNK